MWPCNAVIIKQKLLIKTQTRHANRFANAACLLFCDVWLLCSFTFCAIKTRERLYRDSAVASTAGLGVGGRPPTNRWRPTNHSFLNHHHRHHLFRWKYINTEQVQVVAPDNRETRIENSDHSVISGIRCHRKRRYTEYNIYIQKVMAFDSFLALKVQLVVLVSAFVMVSTVWSVSCLLFFYSRCPPCPPIRNSHIWHMCASYMYIFDKCMSYMFTYMSKPCAYMQEKLHICFHIWCL